MRILLDDPDSDMESSRVSESHCMVSEPNLNLMTPFTAQLERESNHTAPVESHDPPATVPEPESEPNFSSESDGDFVIFFPN